MTSEPTIAEMLDAARAKARAPTRPWWDGLTKKDLPSLYREALGAVCAPAHPNLLAILGRTFTWESYVLPHLRGGMDPLKGMIRNLRDTLDAR